jgi:CDP-diacylglycerol--glycerol-3-phosphate 3-phosphatidyltransferase
MNFQRYSDLFLERTLLVFVPRWISPNMVSLLRIASLPFIWYLLARGSYTAGLSLFIVAALTDAVDGALARTRDQVTELGKVLDAVADRGLIVLVALMFIPRYFGWYMLALLILLELVNSAAAYLSKRRTGTNPGANWAGKIKMVIQCVAFCILFAGIVGDVRPMLLLAYWGLALSFVFAALQPWYYPKSKEGLA